MHVVNPYINKTKGSVSVCSLVRKGRILSTGATKGILELERDVVCPATERRLAQGRVRTDYGRESLRVGPAEVTWRA
jgi:hypothetical protein